MNILFKSTIKLTRDSNRNSISNLIQDIHSNYTKYPVAVGFPQLSSSGFGDTVNLYSDKEETLLKIINETARGVVFDISLNEPEVKPVKITPVTKWISYYVNSKNDRISRSRILRTIDSIEKKGLTPKEGSLTHKIKNLWEKGWSVEKIQKKLKIQETIPSLKIYSASTRQEFYIHINQKEAVGPIVGEFDSYGFSKGGSVPI